MLPIDRLVHELSKLPGIGERTATRLAFFILKEPYEYARSLASAIADVKERVRLCSRCMNITESDPCGICVSPSRDDSSICVVEEPSDMLAVERTRAFRGRYHILHGALSPLDGIGPEDIKIAELLRRLEDGCAKEVIIATNANVEGEATALYISRLLKPTGIKVTRLASGIPVGGDLEYVDPSTINRAFEERRPI
ncbi:MAG TPA: recombination mediator RecR [bacterium]|nr:recombination protein RecR [Myxococcales bacterium]OQA59534.1 MAG: Recombination protein RecR [bacterium ADurb.Bin270]HPW45851.1 recombination mediator RecR [bacterium]HQC50985.1 recombination mediator RecR [bacterium]